MSSSFIILVFLRQEETPVKAEWFCDIFFDVPAYAKNKKQVSYALWSSAHGDLDTSTERAFGTPNDSYEEAGANE